MTPREFKAWFEGFTEALSGVPTKEQWKRIKARVAEIDGEPITERIFIDRYWPNYPRYYWTSASPGVWTTTSYNGNSFNSTTAMYVAGKVDAAELGATS